MVEKSRRWEPVADSTRLDGSGNGERRMWDRTDHLLNHSSRDPLPPTEPTSSWFHNSSRQATSWELGVQTETWRDISHSSYHKGCKVAPLVMGWEMKDLSKLLHCVYSVLGHVTDVTWSETMVL